MEFNKIYNTDCLIGMQQIPDNAIDMILCDLPYGMTGLAWDSIIPLDKLWEQYNRIIKDSGVIALTGSQPFTSRLGASNLKKLKYAWVWEKENGTNFLNAKKMPFKVHEDILIFYDDKATILSKTDKLNPVRDYLKSERQATGLKAKEINELLGSYMASRYFTSGVQFTFPSRKNYEKLQTTGRFQRGYDDLKAEYKRLGDDIKTTYNPQMITGKPYISKKRKPKKADSVGFGSLQEEYITENEGSRYPRSVIKINSEKGLHPTQKPVELFEYLIRTYSNEGETVLDNCIGSGTTAIACINTNRNFIGFELDEKHFQTATNRVANHLKIRSDLHDKEREIFKRD